MFHSKNIAEKRHSHSQKPRKARNALKHVQNDNRLSNKYDMLYIETRLYKVPNAVGIVKNK